MPFREAMIVHDCFTILCYALLCYALLCFAGVSRKKRASFSFLLSANSNPPLFCVKVSPLEYATVRREKSEKLEGNLLLYIFEHPTLDRCPVMFVYPRGFQILRRSHVVSSKK